MNVYGKRCLITGCRGTMVQEFNDKLLYNQLLYYDMLFDVERAKKKASEADKGALILSMCLRKIPSMRLLSRIERDLILSERSSPNTLKNVEGDTSALAQYSTSYPYRTS